MSAIKNGQILLYCHFNEIIKGLETTFQSAALRSKRKKYVSYSTLVFGQISFQ